MNRQDFITSPVKKKHVKHSPTDLDPTLQMRFIGFNLTRYNSLDERMRLNHFKMTC